MKPLLPQNINPKIFLILILFIGAVLRLTGVLSNSFAFTYDVGRDMLALYDITHFQNFPFIGPTTGIGGVFYGPWWYYLLSPFYLLFQQDPQGIAFVLALLGVVTIYLAYVLGKNISGEFLGFAFASIVSVSEIMISLSSQIWNPNIAPFFGILALFVVFKLISDKKPKIILYFYLGILLALSLDIELFYGVMFSLGMTISLILLKKFKFKIQEILYFVTGSLLIFLPRILFEIKNDFLMTRSLILFFQNGSQRLSIFEYIPKRLDVFLSHISESLTQSDKSIGMVVIVVVLTTVVFFYKKAHEFEKKFIIVCVTLFVTFFVGTLIFGQDIWPHYLVGLPIIYILFVAIAFNLIRKNINIMVGFVMLFIIFLLNFHLSDFINSFKKPTWEGNASVFRNQLAVVDYVYTQANNEKFKYVVYTPTVNDYIYKYLFLWYGPRFHGYAPSERSDTSFFILEPDHELPGRLTKWLNDRVNDGNIIKQEEIKGGIIVQTRKRYESIE